MIAPLEQHLGEAGRAVESRIVAPAERGVDGALGLGLSGAHLPLVLVTTALEPWTPDHLAPLLAAIDHCDHVIGRRPVESGRGLVRWLRTLPRRLVFALPLLDIHSPCRLHRLEKLAAIPLQSSSSLLDLEILAKATFFGHLIDEVNVPSMAATTVSRGWWSDLRRLLSEPLFAPDLLPTEEAESQGEGDDRPGGQDRERPGDRADGRRRRGPRLEGRRRAASGAGPG